MEEEETPDHIVFRCTKIRRVEDERGRREWARKEGVGEKGGSGRGRKE